MSKLSQGSLSWDAKKASYNLSLLCGGWMFSFHICLGLLWMNFTSSPNWCWAPPYDMCWPVNCGQKWQHANSQPRSSEATYVSAQPSHTSATTMRRLCPGSSLVPGWEADERNLRLWVAWLQDTLADLPPRDGKMINGHCFTSLMCCNVYCMELLQLIHLQNSGWAQNCSVTLLWLSLVAPVGSSTP